MSKTEEFEAWLDGMTEDLTKKMKEQREIFTTSDGEELDASGMRCIRLLFQGCTNEQLEELGLSEYIEVFDRLTRNFIAANKLEDLKFFIVHNTAMKMLNIIPKLQQ
jgi:hypothetical protein